MNDLAEPPRKETWPRTKHGTIDWEVVFERPEKGLITLVNQASTPDGVLRVSQVIVQNLFNRASDANNRTRFEREINEIMLDANDPNQGFVLEPRKVLIVELLREVKENRILSASFHVTRMQQDARAAAERRGEDQDDPSRAGLITAQDRGAPNDPEDASVTALTEMLALRMQTLSQDVDQTTLLDRPLPFPVSRAFAERMLTLVRDHMAQEMQGACRTFIRKSENQPPDKQVD